MEGVTAANGPLSFSSFGFRTGPWRVVRLRRRAARRTLLASGLGVIDAASVDRVNAACAFDGTLLFNSYN